jgi:hypothetical protein
MIKFYIKLQIKRFHRKILDIGGNPLISYVVLALAFIAISETLLSNLSYLNYSYILLALYFVSTRNRDKQDEFLSTTLSRSDYYLLRSCENIIISLPFLGYMLFKGMVINSLLLIALSLSMIFVRSKKSNQIVIPTPFSRRPFEFTVGFRLSFWMFIIIYYISYQAIKHENFNVGLFSIYAICVVCSLFSFKQENVELVMTFNKSRIAFLNYKIITALGYSFMLCIPSIIALSIYNPTGLHLIALVLIIGLLLVTANSIVKYTSFPNEINLREGMLSMLSPIFFPLVIITLPFFYYQSYKSLEGILND